MIEGHFIVLEGVDGAGTTTQACRLVETLRATGLPVHETCEPSGGPLGVLIRQVLSGRVVVPGVHGPRPPSWNTMALMFAADRLDHVEAEINHNLMDGVTVVCDRYVMSSVAYQSLTAGETEEAVQWVKAINSHARRPDLAIVLDVPADVAQQRRTGRAAAEQMYEKIELQKRLVDFYRTIDSHFPGERIVHVDAARGADEVAADVLQAVRELRGEG